MTSLMTQSALYTAFSGSTPFGNANATSTFGDLSALLAPSLANAKIAAAAKRSEIDADEVKISGLGKLASDISAFQAKVQKLLDTGDVLPASANSSDTSVATAYATSDAQIGSLDLNITQLAEAERVSSGSFADADTTSQGTGTLTIQLGDYDSGSNTFTPSSDPAVNISITGGTLDDIAASINAADAGVTASIVDTGSGYTLSITSDDTGAENEFSITVTDDDANNTDNSGLSQFAYDPTAAAGAGKNLTETRAARDAAYTIEGIGATSASNSGITIASGVSVNLLTAGTTTITVAKDFPDLEQAADDLTAAFNTLQSAIGKLTASGSGELGAQSLGSDFLTGIQNRAVQQFSGTGTYTLLSEIGIEKQSDGTFSVDSDKLLTAFTTDAESAANVLSAAATSFDDFAEPFTQTGGLIDKSAQTLQQQVNFLESQSSGADYALSLYQSLQNLNTGSILSQLYSV